LNNGKTTPIQRPTIDLDSAKKKATAKPSVKFKDLKSKANPKGGFQWGVGRGITSPTAEGVHKPG
jgi:hypothetical protein